MPATTCLCVDVDSKKDRRPEAGIIPIHEPGLDALIKSNIEAERLKFTTSAKEGVDHGLFQLIAVGTPPDEDGSADLKYVLAVARSIGEHMAEYKVVITKSTVPVGTSDKVRAAVAETLRSAAPTRIRRGLEPGIPQGRRGHRDFMRPDRVVGGHRQSRGHRAAAQRCTTRSRAAARS
jgi:UDPglucose 6-dehydrogenase